MSPSSNINIVETAKSKKNFLMGLHEGIYLVSNVYKEKGKPSFMEKVCSMTSTKSQRLAKG